ncbi:hypothetical protein [Sorangium sp. So ce385]|uniref:hypothetical protein n=1 Tax=Sorangium sp. So ce385 TaxID=3133308 RepID=UPI003F5B5FF0
MSAPGAEEAWLSAALPHDVDVDRLRPHVDPAEIDRMFDALSWQTFVALIWPVDPLERPAPSLADARGVPRWRTFRSGRELAPPHGLRPLPWSAARDASGVPARSPDVSDARFRFVPEPTQADGNVLWDQNGHRVMYEVLVNRVLFEFIVKHGLYSVEGQRAFAPSPVYMPPGLHWNKFPQGGQVLERDHERSGAIALKLAWKILGGGDDPRRFYTQSIPVEGDDGRVRRADAGLVGMHVAHKTQSSASWVWSTFEHVDALSADDALTGAVARPMFRDPGARKPANTVPEPDADGRRRTQVERIVPVSEMTESLNRQFRARLSEVGSVWRHYRLLGTQRMARTSYYRELHPIPRYLANPLFETYVPLERSSALCAHRAATLAVSPGGAAQDADFVFLLRRAAAAWQSLLELSAEESEQLRRESVASRALPRWLAARLSGRGLAFDERAQLQCVVPELEWLIADGARTLVVRSETGGGTAVYAPPP